MAGLSGRGPALGDDAAPTSAELRRQAELLAPVLDTSPVGFQIFDTDLRYVYANAAIARVRGVPLHEFTGRTVAEVWPQLPEVVGVLRTIIETGEPQLDTERRIVVEGETRYMLGNRYPIRDGDGRVVGVAVATVDVTANRRLIEVEAEAEALRARAELIYKYEAAQEIAGLGTWEIDLADGRRRGSWQLHRMLGVDEATFNATEVGHFTHVEDRPRLLAALRRLADEGVPFQEEVRMHRTDGVLIHVLWSGRLVRDGAGTPVRLWGTLQDVTERVAMQAAHREAVTEAEMARAALEVEHAALQMVQRAMLPAEVPSVPGIELAVAYQPIENVADVGGDWYDAFILPDGRLAVAVGDVAGHDLRAATVMGQVRNALRAYAMEDGRPGTVLRRANALLMALPDVDMVTAVFGVYDPACHRLTIARAGHPHPVVRSGGRTRVLTGPRGIVLGAFVVHEAYRETTMTLAPGDALLMYTDGLVERRGQDTVQATDRLRRVVDSVPVDAVATEIVHTVTDAMIDPGRLEDDVCLLVLHRPLRTTPGRHRLDPPPTAVVPDQFIRSRAKTATTT